uniref:Uncharacterized protein n=1 Tax=Setaria italica TaxID=4555 RepID=K4AP08_SETIT
MSFMADHVQNLRSIKPTQFIQISSYNIVTRDVILNC